MGASSSQSRVVILVHLQIFLLLLVTGGFARRTVNHIIIILTLKLVASLVATKATSAATARGAASAASVAATTTSTTATTARWLLLLSRCLFLLLKLLFFLLSKLLHLLDLLLELGTTVLLEPGLFFGNLTEAVVEIVGHYWWLDSQQCKLLDNNKIQVEGVLVLDDLLLLLAFLFAGAANRDHVLGFTFSLGLADLDLAVGELLVNLLLNGLALHLGLGLSRSLLVIDDQAGTHLE